jgi:hypothetical protein
MGEPATLEVGMTEADFSNKNLGIRGAIIISAWITHKDKGALTVLDISANKLCDGAFGMDDLGPAIANSKITSLNVSENNLNLNRGVQHITNIIDKGAMTSLNLASNRLYAGGAKIVAEAIKVTKCILAIILVPFSCRSDFSINCCCLLLSAGYGGDDIAESFVERFLQ